MDPDSLPAYSQAADRNFPNWRFDYFISKMERYVIKEYPNFEQSTPKHCTELGFGLQVVRKYAAHHGPSEASNNLEVILLGKMGKFKEAIEFAVKSFEAKPGWLAAVSVSNAYRRAKKPLNGLPYLMKAAELDPKDVTAFFDAVDLHLQHEQYREALDLLHRVLEREPEIGYAQPSICFAQYHLTQDQKWLEQLKEMANAKGDECGMDDVLSNIFYGYSEEDKKQRAQFFWGMIES